MDNVCGGHLPEPAEHDGDFNHHRFCLNGAADNGSVFDLRVNNTDLWWFRWLFDALDGKGTANMRSNRGRNTLVALTDWLVQFVGKESMKCLKCEKGVYDAVEVSKCLSCGDIVYTHKQSLKLDKQRRTLDVLRQANEVCRSVYQITARHGKETNWDAFMIMIKKALNEQHKILWDKG